MRFTRESYEESQINLISSGIPPTRSQLSAKDTCAQQPTNRAVGWQVTRRRSSYDFVISRIASCHISAVDVKHGQG